jgi:hypothetical protein
VGYQRKPACRSYISGPFVEQIRQRCIEVARKSSLRPANRLDLPEALVEKDRGDFSIRSFAAAEFPHLFEQPDVPVTTLLAKRTFWEKATILHAEFHRPADKAMPGRYSRHYYDVAMMAQRQVKQDAFADLDLLAAVVKHTQTFYPSAWAQYPLAVPSPFRFAPAASRIAALRLDYQEMQVMIFGKPPRFDDILQALAALEGS